MGNLFTEKITGTYTTMFLVPCLGIAPKTLEENGFMDGYLDDMNREIRYENSLYLLFKPTSMEKFNQFLILENERTPNLVDDYDYEGGYIVLVYRLESKYLNDYQLFLESKYSMFSNELKKAIPKIVKIMQGNLHRDILSIPYRVVNRTNDIIQYWEEKKGEKYK